MGTHFDPAQVVQAGPTFEATTALTGYARTFTLADRSAMAAVILAMGHVTGSGMVGGLTSNQSSSGFGDPMVEFTVNLIGPRALNDIPDVLRYEPGFSLDLLVDLALPIGEYDDSKTLNLGHHRWYGRLDGRRRAGRKARQPCLRSHARLRLAPAHRGLPAPEGGRVAPVARAAGTRREALIQRRPTAREWREKSRQSNRTKVSWTDSLGRVGAVRGLSQLPSPMAVPCMP
jgi:hypothetical protein